MPALEAVERVTEWVHPDLLVELGVILLDARGEDGGVLDASPRQPGHEGAWRAG